MSTTITPEGPELSVAVIGSGLMAKSHTLAYRNVQSVYGSVPLRPRLSLLVDATDELAATGAAALGFERWATDWREAVADPGIDVIDIVTPNWLHEEIALAAIAAGKHVYCEKPLALSAQGAEQMYRAAVAAGVTTLVGFNYLFNPAVAKARHLIRSGALGDIWSFRGAFVLDAVADPAVPFTWRFDRSRSGSGALGDLGAHVIATAHDLVGPIAKVVGLSSTVISHRPEPAGVFGYGTAAAADSVLRAVENDDITNVLVVFANGATGSIEVSRVSTGHTWENTWEVTGSRGAVRFDQQNGYKLDVFLAADGERGFRSVDLGPGDGAYGQFWPFAGCPIGVHELKIIEVRELLDAIAEGRPAYPGFEAGWRVAQVLDAVEESATDQRWVDIGHG